MKYTMNILIVCSYRNYSPLDNHVSPFIGEQVQALEKLGCKCHYFLIQGGGMLAYLKAVFRLKKEIKKTKPQLIHAHGGLCGFVANTQRKVAVVTTYHGSDIYNKITRLPSGISILLSAHNIFVSQKLIDIICPNKKYSLIPCGIDLEVFYPQDKSECRKKLGWNENNIYILFSKEFHIKVKNYPLAKAAVDKIPDAKLVELKGFSRKEINLLMNASDVALMTSFTEGSPQFIKEAMACNCPIVSTDVGDVKEMIKNTGNCFISSYEANDVASKINIVLSDNKRTNGRDSIQKRSLDNSTIALKVLNIYHSICR